MICWQHAFRFGFAPGFSLEALRALRRGLADDDAALIQGATTSPPPLQCVQDWPVEGACLLAYAGWKGERLTKVRDVEEYFTTACVAAGCRLEEPAGCGWLLNWFDDTPRAEVRRLLVPEIDRELSRRAVAAAVCATTRLHPAPKGVGRHACCRRTV